MSKKIVEIKQHDPDLMFITWMINNICPNQCTYCQPALHSGSNHNYKWNDAKQFINFLLSRYTKMHCSISGGEPTMSPFLLELVKMFYDAGHTISISTNGYKSQEYWQEIAPYIGKIIFTYHPEFVTKQYFENIEVASKLTNVYAKVMMLSSHWDQCVEAYNNLTSNPNFMTTPGRVLESGNYNGSTHYTPEQIAWFNDTTAWFTNQQQKKIMFKGDVNLYPAADFYFNDGTIANNGTLLINQGQTNFKGYECDIGLHSLFISPWGRIYRGNCLLGGVIGDIANLEQIQWPDNPILCEYDICSCVSDILISKRLLKLDTQLKN